MFRLCGEQLLHIEENVFRWTRRGCKVAQGACWHALHFTLSMPEMVLCLAC